MFTERGQGLIRWGAGLLLIAVVSGFLIPRVADPLLGLAAHVQGLMNAFLLLLVGLIWSRLQIGYLASVTVYWGLIAGAYVTLIVQIACAGLGIGGSIFPLVAGGHLGTPAAERIVRVLVEGAAGVTAVAMLLVARAALRKPAI